MAIHHPQSIDDFDAQLGAAGPRLWIGFFSTASSVARDAQRRFEAVAARADRPTVVVDVATVKGAHGRFGVTAVPTVVTLDRGRMLDRIVGARSEQAYAEALGVMPPPQRDASGREVPVQRRVKVYVTDTCPWCVRVKSYLRQHHVTFSEVNVSRDERAAQEMVRRSGQQGVPQVEINGRMIVGFDKPAIDSMLGLGRAS